MYEQLLPILGGVLAPFIVKQLTKLLKVEDFPAWLTAIAVSVVLALLAMLLTGQVGIADFTVVNFALVFVKVYVAADTLFKLGKYVRPK